VGFLGPGPKYYSKSPSREAVNCALSDFIITKQESIRAYPPGYADASIPFFQRHYLIYRNGQGGCVWTLRATYSKGCRSLNFVQEYVKAVFSNDLYVIFLFHDLLLRPLRGCRQEKCNAAACWFATPTA